MARFKGDGIKDGRPSKYQPSYAKVIYNLIIHDWEISDSKLAKALGIAKGTFNLWKSEHDDFLNAYQDAWDLVTCGKAERSLAMLAEGYDYIEKKTETGETATGMINKETITTKHVSPNMDAIKTILRNRNAKRWPKDDIGVSLPPLKIVIDKGEDDTGKDDILPAASDY